jgi:hypothetical protein
MNLCWTIVMRHDSCPSVFCCNQAFGTSAGGDVVNSTLSAVSIRAVNNQAGKACVRLVQVVLLLAACRT